MRHSVTALFASLIVAATTLMTGCGDAPPDVAVARDPWVTSPPAAATEPEIVPAGTYHTVAPERIAEAEQFLTSEMVSQISPGEVEYFVAKPVPLPDVDRPFLIRAAYRSVPEFTVRIVGNALWVSSHDAPGDAAPIKHQPLVLIIREAPEVVYVTIGQ
jgi:hypothetical protein